MSELNNLANSVKNEVAENPLKKPAKVGKSREVLDGLTDVYRHYDENGVLLYVGISVSAPMRQKGHRHCSHWFKRIAYITVQHCETRTKAELAEGWAIKYEKPLYNKLARFVPDVDPYDYEEERVRRAIETSRIVKLFAAQQAAGKTARRARLKKDANDSGIENSL